MLLAVFLTTEIAFAQGGNLQFNQVLNITPGMSYTVPTGKVFKLESITGGNSASVTTTFADFSADYCACNYASLQFLSIDVLQFSGKASSYLAPNCISNCSQFNTSQLSIPILDLPIWLNTGKTVSLSSIVSGVLITGIEFNITN